MTRARDIADRKVADNDSLVFGAGSDLTITHDASDSLITDSGTGNLQIRADDFYVMKQDGSEVMIRADTDSFVKLYYDNAEKLATTSVGIGVDQLFGLSDTDTGIALGANGANIMQFYTGNSERVRIQAAGGISFNGDSAAANALDDYEEGSWTPVVAFGGGTSGITYGTQFGRYVKIGELVMLQCTISMSSKGSSTGAARIQGMPFNQGGTGFHCTGMQMFNFTGGTEYVVAQTAGSSNEVAVIRMGADQSLDDSDFANNTGIRFSIVYRI